MNRKEQPKQNRIAMGKMKRKNHMGKKVSTHILDYMQMKFFEIFL